MTDIRSRGIRCLLRSTRRTGPAGSIGSTVLFGMPYAMPAGSAVLPTAFTEGDIEEMCLAAGTSVGVIDQVLPAARIVGEVGAGLTGR